MSARLNLGCPNFAILQINQQQESQLPGLPWRVPRLQINKLFIERFKTISNFQNSNVVIFRRIRRFSQRSKSVELFAQFSRNHAIF